MGERWSRVERSGRHIRRRKKRIIEKQRGEGNRTRRWKWREATSMLYLSVILWTSVCFSLSLFVFFFIGDFVYNAKCVN